ncbi:MAG: hypothetical protein D6706_08105 [Chloroflexi bacterium]|nr:MAG: hypothetical protein D6706_08105 [Chloroflexota bacterium]
MSNSENPTPLDNLENIGEDVIKRLLELIEKTREDAYSCEEAYALLDEYVELVAGNEAAAQVMPLVERHLDLCPDCREKFEVLLQILQSDEGERP